MKMLPAVLTALLWLTPSVWHAKYQRPVQVLVPGQNYIAIDQTIWNHAQTDLDDLRLAASDAEIAYALVIERGSSQEQRKELAVLQQASLAGKTQFLIDMSGLAEYDHVQIKLTTQNFVAHARVEGDDDPHARSWAALGNTILYDLSRENLGSNRTLRLPRSTYKYLRVTIDGPVAPAEVQGATSEMAEEHSAVWREVSGVPAKTASGKDTIFTFAVSDKVPIERVVFSIAPSPATNFRRDVEIRDEKDNWLGSGNIERIHMVRGGQKIDSEQFAVSLSGTGHTSIKALVHNGDDRALSFAGVRLEQLERRIYFEASGPAELTLYYGDEKLTAPVYDYAKLFQQNTKTTAASLGPEVPNAAFRERPDERPWSERHPVILWVAIIAAVVGLSALALRSMRTTTG